MENLEKNDSTDDLIKKDLSDEPVGEQTDTAGMQENEVLKTDTSFDEVPDPSDSSSEALDLSESSEEVPITSDSSKSEQQPREK